jgi:colicin import membrane protein
VHAKLIVLEPKPPKVAPPKQSKPPEKVAQLPKPVEKIAPVEAPPEVDIEAEKQKLEQEREKREELERQQRQQRLQELANQAFDQALENESINLANDADAELASSYRQGIYLAIVANWSRPPSARNGMEAKLQVELVPTGEVVAVILLNGSGNLAFDRSAEAAVRKARRFEVPKESAMFERYFRRFSVLFKPEDLLR